MFGLKTAKITLGLVLRDNKVKSTNTNNIFLRQVAVRLNLSAKINHTFPTTEQCFSLTTNQHQPFLQPNKDQSKMEMQHLKRWTTDNCIFPMMSSSYHNPLIYFFAPKKGLWLHSLDPPTQTRSKHHASIQNQQCKQRYPMPSSFSVLQDVLYYQTRINMGMALSVQIEWYYHNSQDK